MQIKTITLVITLKQVRRQSQIVSKKGIGTKRAITMWDRKYWGWFRRENQYFGAWLYWSLWGGKKKSYEYLSNSEWLLRYSSLNLKPNSVIHWGGVLFAHILNVSALCKNTLSFHMSWKVRCGWRCNFQTFIVNYNRLVISV